MSQYAFKKGQNTKQMKAHMEEYNSGVERRYKVHQIYNILRYIYHFNHA